MHIGRPYLRSWFFCVCVEDTLGGNSAFPHCPVVSHLSVVCPCHIDALRVFCITSGHPGSSGPFLPSFRNHDSVVFGIGSLTLKRESVMIVMVVVRLIAIV